MSNDLFARLSAPFPPEKVSWRVGSTTQDKTRGMALAYIDARDVMDRLDEVVGPARWQCDYPHANGKTVCRIGILLADEFDEFPNANPEWVWKADGAGDTDYEAEKGALSDAFKRAAVRWGIGRYLYDLDSPWVEVEQRGKSFNIKSSEMGKLAAVLRRGAPSPAPAAKPSPRPDPLPPELEPRDDPFGLPTEAALAMANEIARCEGTEDIDRLKRTPEFLAFWKGANARDRQHVQETAETAKKSRRAA